MTTAPLARAPALRRPPIVAIVLIAIVYLVYAWDRFAVPIELVEIRRAFDLSLPAGGLLGSVFTFGLTLMAIPAGFIVMRFGTRASLVLGTLVFSIGTAYTACGFGLPDLAAARIASGIGEGLYNVALFSFLGGLSVAYRGTATGLAASLFGIGQLLAPAVIGGLLVLTGHWQGPFVTFGAVGVLGALLIGASLRGTGTAAGSPGDAPRTPITWAGIRQVLAPRNIMVCLVIACEGFAGYAYLFVYTSYLRSYQGMSLRDAGFAFGLVGIGSIVGGTPLGYVADRVGRKRYLACVAVLGMIVGTALFNVPPRPLVAGLLSLVFGAITNTIYANCYALIQDQVEHRLIPLATGLVATIYFLPAAISGYALPAAAARFGWHAAGALVFGGTYAVALVLVLGLIAGERIVAGRRAAGGALE